MHILWLIRSEYGLWSLTRWNDVVIEKLRVKFEVKTQGSCPFYLSGGRQRRLGVPCSAAWVRSFPVCQLGPFVKEAVTMFLIAKGNIAIQQEN